MVLEQPWSSGVALIVVTLWNFSLNYIRGEAVEVEGPTALFNQVESASFIVCMTIGLLM